MKNDFYKAVDFAQCTFNPMAKLPMLDEYKRLYEITEPEWEKDVNLDSVLRYVVAMYDTKSPLIKAETDYKHRKDLAAEVAELPEEIRDEVFHLRYSVDKLTDPYIPELIFRFLIRFAKSREFAAIQALEFKYWEQIQMVLKPISGKDSKTELEAVQKKELIANAIDNDMKRLKDYYKSFFGDDDLEQKIVRRITPEQIAKL